MPSIGWRRLIDLALLGGLLFTVLRFSTSRRPESKEMVPGWEWPRPSRHLVLAIRASCPECQASAAFYRRVVDVAKREPNRWLVSVLSSDRAPELSKWLAEQGIRADNVVGTLDMRQVGFRATPTLLLVTSAGVVTDIIVGSLSGPEEIAVEARLQDQLKSSLERNRYARAVNARSADELRLRGAIVIDAGVRNPRPGSPPPSGVLRIPYDELATRAPLEVDVTKPIVIDCRRQRLGRCEMASEALLASGAQEVYLLYQPHR
jgi:hypothetical protein